MRRAIFDAYQDGKHSLLFMLIRYARPALIFDTHQTGELGGRPTGTESNAIASTRIAGWSRAMSNRPTIVACVTGGCGRPWLDGLAQSHSSMGLSWRSCRSAALQQRGGSSTAATLSVAQRLRSPVSASEASKLRDPHSLQPRLSFSVTRKVACVRHRTAAPVRQAQALQKEQALVAASST